MILNENGQSKRRKRARNFILIVAGLSVASLLVVKGVSRIKSYFSDLKENELLAVEELEVNEDFIEQECAKVFETLKTFNSIVSSEKFRKPEDKDKQLFIDWNQMMSNNIYLNINPRGDYPNIFSEYHLDAKQINEDFNQVALIYLMYLARATEPSGFGELITTDTASKELFEKFEQLHIDSNKLSAKDNVSHAKKVIKEYTDLISFLKDNKDKINPGVVRLILISAKRFQYSWAYSTVSFPKDLAEELGRIEGTCCVKTDTSLDWMANWMANSSIKVLTADYKIKYLASSDNYINQLNDLGIYNPKLDTNLMANDPLLFDKNTNGVVKSKASDLPQGTVIKKGSTTKGISEKELQKEPKEIKDSVIEQKQEIEDEIKQFNNKEEEGAYWYSLGYETARPYAFNKIKDNPKVEMNLLKQETTNHVYKTVNKPTDAFFLEKFNGGIEKGFNQAVKDAEPYINAEPPKEEIIIFEEEDYPLMDSSTNDLSSQINSLKNFKEKLLAFVTGYKKNSKLCYLEAKSPKENTIINPSTNNLSLEERALVLAYVLAYEEASGLNNIGVKVKTLV